MTWLSLVVLLLLHTSSELCEIPTFFGFEFCEFTFFNKSALFKYHHSVALFHSTQSVGDDYWGTFLHDVVECDLDLLLRFFIKSWCCLIQYQYFRLSDDSPGNSNSLFLATRELAAPKTTINLEPLMQFYIMQQIISVIDIPFNCLELALLLLLLHQLLQLLSHLTEFIGTHFLDDSGCLLLHLYE